MELKYLISVVSDTLFCVLCVIHVLDPLSPSLSLPTSPFLSLSLPPPLSSPQDFALDPDIHRMHLVAHHMVRHLTAGMALITYREPLLLSIRTNLKATSAAKVYCTCMCTEVCTCVPCLC